MAAASLEHVRLFEAIVEANHRALSGDERAGLRPDEWAEALPVVVLTCFDPRLHPLMPEVLGVSESDFIWVTNAGNVITSPLSSTVRSLALACGMHDGKEIAILGHTDCRFFQPVRFLLEGRLRSRGIDLGAAASRLDEFLERLVNERSNVRAAVQSVRHSPLIPRAVPVHGLMVDIESGQLEWVVNGYEVQPASGPKQEPLPPPGALQPGDFRLSGDLPPIGTV